MLETPWVSTPRRSVIASTSAASAASSGVTPSFSKIRVTVSRRAESDTRTWSFSGTLKRSRIMGRASPGNPSRLHRPASVLDFLAGVLHMLGLGLASSHAPMMFQKAQYCPKVVDRIPKVAREHLPQSARVEIATPSIIEGHIQKIEAALDRKSTRLHSS